MGGHSPSPHWLEHVSPRPPPLCPLSTTHPSPWHRSPPPPWTPWSETARGNAPSLKPNPVPLCSPLLSQTTPPHPRSPFLKPSTLPCLLLLESVRKTKKVTAGVELFCRRLPPPFSNIFGPQSSPSRALTPPLFLFARDRRARRGRARPEKSTAAAAMDSGDACGA